MKIRKNWLATIFLAILLASLAAPTLAQSTSASGNENENGHIEIEDVEHWRILKTDIISVLFPRSGRKPIFLWWYTKDPNMIYAVKYQGLIEYFAFNELGLRPEFYKRLHHALAEKLYELFIKNREEHYTQMGETTNLMVLRYIMMQIYENWHAPMLHFNAAVWNLTDVAYITTPDEKIIGVTFAFKLVAVPWQPRFKFAENNIMIRVRFYNTTVKETVPGTNIKYTVNAGEMKMDLIVNKWEWNIDLIRPLIIELREHGIEIPEGKTRLALWVNLASINLTKLQEAEREPEEIEYMSTASHMDVEGVGHISIEQNQTMMGEDEKPILTERPRIELKFANETAPLAGFFRFVSSAKVTTPTDVTRVVPVKAAYIAAGAHMRLFMGYPYFGNNSLEHDPSIGLDVPEIDTTPQYKINVPSGTEIVPVVIEKILPLLVTPELAAALIGAASLIAIVIFAARRRRKTVNVVR